MTSILKVNQKLLKANSLFHEGKMFDAEKLYKEILKTQPRHTDAIHNLGLLALAMNNLEVAVILFKKAFDLDRNFSQYLLSYTTTLVGLDRLYDAKVTLENTNLTSLNNEHLNTLKKNLKNLKRSHRIIFAIEELYRNSKKKNILNASKGWFYTAIYEKKFIEKENLSLPTSIKILTKKIRKNNKIKNTESNFNPGEIIHKLNNLKSLREKFNQLKTLTRSNEASITNDSFCDNIDIDILSAQKKTFNSQGLNLLIIGAGVAGLFFANIVKHKLGSDVNVLVIDNRSVKKNTRESYNREWLTNVPANIIQKYTPANITDLLGCFGKNGKLGLPINILETLLMLSCKEQDVKFYFEQKLDYPQLNNKSIDLFFDATGGRLNKCNYLLPNINKKIEVPFKNVHFTLKASNSLHYPYIKNSKILNPMLKITGIPKNLIKEVIDFMDTFKTPGLFYIWEGFLKDEFNEGLIFINITNNEHYLLSLLIDSSTNLKKFIKKKFDISFLDKKIISLLHKLLMLDINENIKIEQPFSYSPYINLNAEFGHFNGKRIFPIGDSLFSGNPKSGNALVSHLEFINEIVEKF